MSLRHQLSLQGYSILNTVVTLTADSEYKFVDLMIRFVDNMLTDLRLGKIANRVTVCEYIAVNAAKVIGGKRERIEEELNRMVSMLDFAGQSIQISLYKWIVEQNLTSKHLSIHSKILTRIKALNSDLMLSKSKNLERVSLLFKDMVDLVAKFISPDTLPLFVEKVEEIDPRRGGFRDKKVNIAIALRAALGASVEAEQRSIAKKRQKMFEQTEQAEARTSKSPPHRTSLGMSGYYNESVNERSKSPARDHQLEYDQEGNKYTLYRRYQDQTDAGMSDFKDADFGLDEGDDDLIEQLEQIKAFEDDDLFETDTRQGARNIAGKYFFKKNENIDDIKRSAAQNAPIPPEEEMAQLTKRHEEACKKNQDLDELYRIVLEQFGEAKRNYTVLGKEARHCSNLAYFLKETYPNDKEVIKICHDAEETHIIDIKKMKLCAGHLLSASSTDIRVDEIPIYKFGVDKEDYVYHTRCPVCGHNEDRAVVYELIEKDPTDTTKGVKHAKIELRLQKEKLTDSPLKEYVEEAVVDEEDEDAALIKKSMFYDAKQKSRETKSAVKDDYKFELGDMFEIDQRIKHGMAELVMRKYLAAAVAPMLQAQKMAGDDSLSDADDEVQRLILNTISLNKRFSMDDFEKGIGPSYIEFDGPIDEGEQKKGKPQVVFERNKTAKAEALVRIDAPRKPKLATSQKSPKKKNAKPLEIVEPSDTKEYQTGSNGKYILYEDDDPAFGIYTKVKMNKKKAQKQPVTRFNV